MLAWAKAQQRDVHVLQQCCEQLPAPMPPITGRDILPEHLIMMC